MALTTIDPDSTHNRLTKWLREELHPQQFFASLYAALPIYFIVMIVILSIASLIFSGALASQLSYAIGFAVAGAILLLLTPTLFSSYSGAITVTQDTPAVIVALAVSSVVAQFPAHSAPEMIFPTVIALTIGATIAMGAIYLLLGFLGLGGLTRFLPYPVLGGFLAGTGALLVMGGFSVATNIPMSIDMIQPGIMVKWIPAGFVGLATLLAQRRFRSPFALVATFVLSTLTFHAVTLPLGISQHRALAAEWLLGPFPDQISWHMPFDMDMISLINWPILLNAIPIIAPAFLISTVALLLNASGLELIVKRDISLNRELIIAGIGNIASGLAGGLIGYPAISLSALYHSLRPGKRLPGLLVCVMLLITLISGASLIALIPRFVLGGLLVYVGLELLDEWVIQSWKTFPTIDYAIVLSILLMIVVQGFLWGLAIGVLMTVILFVVNSSRTDSIQHELSGATYHSRFSRNAQEREILSNYGEQLAIFRLRGFIFFGTAHNLYERIHLRLAHHPGSIRYIVLDFQYVSGLDATGLRSFRRLSDVARSQQVELVLTGLAPTIQKQLRQSGFTDATAELRLFTDADRGIEWCENQILGAIQGNSLPTPSLRDFLLTILPDGPRVDALMSHLTRRELSAGEYIVYEGDEPDYLFLLESGQITAQLERPGSETIRLETMQGGHIIGELGFFLGTHRNASIVTDQPSVVYSLHRDNWATLIQEHPEVVQTLNTLVIRFLGRRVSHLTQAVEALNH